MLNESEPTAAILTLVTCLCLGCGGTSEEQSDRLEESASTIPGAADTADIGDSPEPADPEVDSTVTFDWVKRVVFMPHCAGCHYPRIGSTFIESREALLSARSRSVNMAYIVPGSPDASYLLRKLEGTQGEICESQGRAALYCGPQMPLPAGGTLPLGALESIRGWISDGAP